MAVAGRHVRRILQFLGLEQVSQSQRGARVIGNRVIRSGRRWDRSGDDLGLDPLQDGIDRHLTKLVHHLQALEDRLLGDDEVLRHAVVDHEGLTRDRHSLCIRALVFSDIIAFAELRERADVDRIAQVLDLALIVASDDGVERKLGQEDVVVSTAPNLWDDG